MFKIFLTAFVCLFMWVCTWPGAHVLVREQLVGVGPLLSPCGLRDPAQASRGLVGASYLKDHLTSPK